MIWSAGSFGKSSPRRKLSAAIFPVKGRIVSKGCDSMLSSQASNCISTNGSPAMDHLNQLAERERARARWLVSFFQLVQDLGLSPGEPREVHSPPEQDMCFEKIGDQSDSTSHGSSEKCTMSPLIFTSPFQVPFMRGFTAVIRSTRATGRPRLVITIRSPFDSTSARSRKHFALNSVTGRVISFMLHCTTDHLIWSNIRPT